MITKQEILKLSSLPILEVAASLNLEVSRNRHCLCPFHLDGRPSMVLYPDSNRFYCFACRARGGVIDLTERVLHLDFLGACSWLARTFRGVGVAEVRHAYNSSCAKPKQEFDFKRYGRCFEHPYLNRKASAFLFGERKLHPSVVEWCRLSSYGDSLQIPYYDVSGRLVGAQWRNLGSKGARFQFPSGSHCYIYNLPILRSLRPGEELYVAEGCSDCWSLMSSGHKAVAIPSATLLNVSEAGILRGLNLHMYPDNDQPGCQLFEQLKSLFPQLVRHPLPEGCKDYSDSYLKFIAL